MTTVTQTTNPGQPGRLDLSAAPVSRAVITSTPAGRGDGASVLDPVVVRAANGTLDTVIVTNPDGKEVTGALSADGTTWTSGEPLGYGRTYRIEAAARDAAGLTTSSSSSFTTVAPAGAIFPSFEPPPDRGQVGVGQPISVIFDKAPPDKAAAERAAHRDHRAGAGGRLVLGRRTHRALPAPGVLAGRHPDHPGRQDLRGGPGRRDVRGNRPHPEPDHRAGEDRHRRRRHQDQ